MRTVKCMSYEQIEMLVSSMGCPCSYNHFDANSAPPLPCIVFYYDTRKDFIADNRIYAKIVSLTVELYTGQKDLKTESQIENVFRHAKMPYTKNEDFDDGSQTFCESYTTTIMLRGDGDEPFQPCID